ncbi:MAG: FG-GAP repeat protein, partial [Deltaproteobacteria bacterium]|nr:FG-GAP repeat protein [Deltaproteobacteria bacterium]
MDPLIFDYVDTLTPSSSVQVAEFGNSVSIDGDYAIVGARYDGSQSGSAFVFERSEGVWSEVDKLGSGLSLGANDFFGVSVDISGIYAIVGANGDDGPDDGTANGSGAAYVFLRGDDGWDLQQKLLPSPGQAGEEFGHSVAISGDRVVVG